MNSKKNLKQAKLEKTPKARKPAKKASKTTKKVPGRKQAKDPVREDPKNVALPKIVEKAITAVKNKIKDVVEKKQPAKRKPFGGKGGRKKKPPELSPEKQAEIKRIREDSADFNEPKGGCSSSSDNPANAFFYSNDKFFNQFEDDEIISDIQKAYPKFNPLEEQDPVLKKAMFEMLQNEQFVSFLLQKYNMDMQDFFKFLIRKNQSIFTKQCIQRVQRIIKDRKYDESKDF